MTDILDLPDLVLPDGGDRRACENAVKAHSEALDARRLVEERRLFYVAVTRAERVLLLSGHRWPATGEKPRLPSEFLVEAQSGGTCIVRVTSSGFGTGADWESEWWDDMGANWQPAFDNLRLYLANFPGEAATPMEATAVHACDADALWKAIDDELALGAQGATVQPRGTTGTRISLQTRMAAATSAVVRGRTTARGGQR